MEKLTVFKIGGKVIDDANTLNTFLDTFQKVPSPKILVHGGGKWVSSMCEKLDIPVNMVDGRRITDADTLEVVKMMLAGVANKNIVSQLQARQINALGFTGADANLIRAHKRPLKNGVDYGYVGDVDEVNAEVLSKILQIGITPVLAAMTHDGKGQLLNTNADTIASTVAVGMSGVFQVELVYCFEMPGVLQDINNPESVISKIDRRNYDQLKGEGVIHTGMIPKIDNAFDAINKGVTGVRICHAMDIANIHVRPETTGTLIY